MRIHPLHLPLTKLKEYGTILIIVCSHDSARFVFLVTEHGELSCLRVPERDRSLFQSRCILTGGRSSGLRNAEFSYVLDSSTRYGLFVVGGKGQHGRLRRA